MDNTRLTSQNACNDKVFNKLPIPEAKIYVNKINSLQEAPAMFWKPYEAYSYKTSNQGITATPGHENL